MSLYPETDLYRGLLEAIQSVPVIDCHEHFSGPMDREEYKEPLSALLHFYVQNDLESASFGISGEELRKLADPNTPTDDKWLQVRRLWKATEHTAYARVTKLVLKDVYGQEELTREALDAVAAQLPQMGESRYMRTLEQAGIRAVITDILSWLPGGMESFLSGKHLFPPSFHPMIPLPCFHPTHFSAETIRQVGAWANWDITNLNEYLEACYIVFQKLIEKGAIGMKDQSAYEREIAYSMPTHHDAEQLFNQVISDPRNSLGWGQSKPLNDYLFHEFMRFARQLDIPVQIHTGHMAGTYNRIEKTNAALFTPVLEQHRQTRFDLFHGNWPYMGEYLFLGKNYPNVALDLCWLHIIDPMYAIELLERAVLTMPSSKIHAFGGDYDDLPEFSAAHLRIARQNVAAALANLVSGGWLREEEALRLAEDWFYNNPNRFFRLNLPPIV